MYDCIVIGAGPAGLSASLFLARYRHRILTFHHNSPRNEYAHGIHGFLGHHGISPAELLARGRDEVTDHGGLIIEACVNRVEQLADERFIVTAGEQENSQSFEARSLVLATGLRDLTPDCPGFREFYGVTVHHCPDCDGYESSGKRLAALGSGESIVGFALSLLSWSNDITVLTDGRANELTNSHRLRLAQLNIPVRDEKIAALEGDHESRQLQRVIFKEGKPLSCDSLFFNLGTVLASNLHEMLGCRLDEECGLVWVDKNQQTSVVNVYAAGDITPHSQLAVVAAAEGAMAAIHLHQSLTAIR